jgi:hypothetical protein
VHYTKKPVRIVGAHQGEGISCLSNQDGLTGEGNVVIENVRKGVVYEAVTELGESN